MIDKLVDECTENVEEVKPVMINLAKMKIVINAVLTQCILCYFGYFLQLISVE